MDFTRTGWVLLLFMTAPGVSSAAQPTPVHPVRPAASPPSLPALSEAELFSRRARRRSALLLRLRLDELRLADLERARAAIRRTLPVDELIAGGARSER